MAAPEPETYYYFPRQVFTRGQPEPEPVCLHKIIVTHVRPPIPNADHYVAHSDDLGADDSPYGTGPDAASAIEDLIRKLEEPENM